MCTTFSLWVPSSQLISSRLLRSVSFLRLFCSSCSVVLSQFASFLYPTLRAAVYQISDISDFMTSCFPEVRDLPHPLEKTNETARSLIHSKVSEKRFGAS